MGKNGIGRNSSNRNSRLIVVLFGSCLGLAIVAGTYYLFHTYSPDAAVPRSMESNQNDDDYLRGQVQQLSQQVKILRAQQASSRIQLNAVANQNGEVHGDEVAPDPIAEGNGSQALHREMTLEEELAETQQRYDFLDEAFQSENRDPAWSANTENEIATAFQSEGLANTALQSASCSSSMCKVEVRLSDEVDYEKFQTTFTQTVQPFLPRGTMRKIAQDDGSTLVTSYLARPTARLPRWRPARE
jgi:hypothetical protein